MRFLSMIEESPVIKRMPRYVALWDLRTPARPAGRPRMAGHRRDLLYLGASARHAVGDLEP